MPRSDFRRFVPEWGKAFHYGKDQDSFYEAVAAQRSDRRRNLVQSVLGTPFQGVTTNGVLVPDLFELRSEGAPTRQVFDAATAFLGRLAPDLRQKVCLPIATESRRLWANGIVHWEDYGLWLLDASETLKEGAMGVVRASLSATGFEKTRNLMKLNGFLGELVGAPRLLGEWCYTLHFFGEPSMTEPWGWQLSGHHLCLTCFILKDQMTLTPVFMGAEPRYIDEGPNAGIAAFDDEEFGGLALVRSLSSEQQKKAIFANTILENGLPPGRHQGNDGMMFGGAYQDNRIIPYEGVSGAELDAKQRRALLDLARSYLGTLQEGPLQARMADLEKHIRQTHFCWAGGMDEQSVFYYRIQSPVVFIEFDHHKGVVLNNPTPERFHVHTIVRTPNGNDYGMDLLRLHYESAPHHRREERSRGPVGDAPAHAHDHSHEHENGHSHEHGHEHGHDHAHGRGHE